MPYPCTPHILSAKFIIQLHAIQMTDTRRPPAVFVGKTLAGSDKTVKALCPLITQSHSQDRRHESVLIWGEKCLKGCHRDGA